MSELFLALPDYNLWKYPPKTIISGTVAWEMQSGYGNTYEPNVVYDANPRILTGLSNVYKWWYSGGWSSPGIGYGESENIDDVVTKYSGNPIITGSARSCIFTLNGQRYMYRTNPSDTAVDLYTLVNDVTPQLHTANVIVLGGGGAWDAGNVANTLAVIDAGGNFLGTLYEAKSGVGAGWALGLCTGPNPWTLTKYGGNPIMAEAGVSRGGPGLAKVIAGRWHIWMHGSTYGTGLPTDLFRYRSTGADLTGPYEQYPAERILARRYTDEGIDTVVGQIADPVLIEAQDGQTWCAYAAASTGTSYTGMQHIKIIKQADQSLFTVPGGGLGSSQVGGVGRIYV